MLKRNIITVLLLCAYTIVLGHSIIPHHHHDDHEHELEHPSVSHHDDHESDHSGQDTDDHSSAFGDYSHSTVAGDMYQAGKYKITLNKISTSYIVSLFSYIVIPVESRPPVVWPADEHIPISRHCLSPKGLRAPPFLLA
jgi:hypothetical protein